MEIWTKRLMELFAQANETYRDLERSTGIPKSALQRYITGDNVKVPLDRLEKLAQHYGVTAEYLVGWDGVDENELTDMRSNLVNSPGLRALVKAAMNVGEDERIKMARMMEAYHKE